MLLVCAVMLCAQQQAPESSIGAPQAEAWEAEAAALRRSGRPEDRAKAIPLQRQAADAWKSIGDREREAKALTSLGQLLDLSGNAEQALTAFQSAADLLPRDTQPAARAAALYGIAKIRASRYEHGEAVRLYREALELRRQSGDRFEQALILHNLGAEHWSTAGNEEALARYREALAIREELDDKPGLAYTHYGIALTHWTSGERQQALDAARKSEAIWKELGSPFGQANAWNSIGLLCAELGDAVRAREAYAQAMALWKQAGSATMQAYTRNNLGMLAASRGQLREAARAYREALPVLEAANDRRGIAYVLHNLGDLALLRGAPGEAMPFYERSLATKRIVGDRYGEAVTTERLAAATSASGNAEGALRLFQTALDQHQAMGNRAGEFMALAGLGRTLRDLGDTEAGKLRYQQALSLAEQDRTDIADEDLRISYFTTVQSLYTEYISFLCSLYEANGDSRFLEEAFLANERSRARQLLDNLMRMAAAPASGPALETAGDRDTSGEMAAWLRREQAGRSRLRAAAQRLQRLYSTESSTAERDLARAQFERLLREWSGRHIGQVASSSTGHAFAAVLPTEDTRLLASLRAKLIDNDTVLVAFRLGERTNYAWAVTHGGISFARLPGETALRAIAQRYLGAVTAREPSPAGTDLAERNQRIHSMDAALEQASRELSWVLFSKVLRNQQARRLVILPDGFLGQIPFASLPQPFNPAEPMVAKWEIARAPSASVLAALQDRLEQVRANRSLTIVADPVFSADDARIPSGTRLAALSAVSERTGPPLPRLRFTMEEARRISASTAQPVRLYTGFQASRELLSPEALEQPGILHLATHSWVDERAPEASGVAFSNLRENGDPVDGFLRLFEIYKLRMNAELVVLSGCRTAGGGVLEGEGINGLVRGFLNAGAPRVLATLWDVQDNSTAEMMDRFYRHYLREGRSAGEALRRAQLSLRNTGHLSHPYYWAGYVLEGDWR